MASFSTTRRGPLHWLLAVLGTTIAAVSVTAAHAAGELTTVHNFSGGTSPTTGGAEPLGGLVLAGDGNYYGTSQVGGANDVGTVYRLTPDGTVTTIHSFSTSGGGGYTPVGNLTVGPDGALYGITTVGGQCAACGTAYKIDTQGRFQLLHAFALGKEGGTPTGDLLLAKDGNFYGTLSYGGRNRNGALYRMTPAGSVKVIHAFGATPADGLSPRSPVIQASDGNLYGTTALGGRFGSGTVYQVTRSGRSVAVRNLHGFNAENLDGYAPTTAPVEGSDGALYGTTSAGGAPNYGTIYRLSAQDGFSKLHTFQPATGGLPAAPMIRGSDGALYGTTQSGGSALNGTVYRLGTDGSYSVLHSFLGPDGSSPMAPLLQAGPDTLLGTTLYGGDASAGTLFRLTLSR